MIQGSWLDTTDNDGFTPEIPALIRTHASGAGFGLLANAAIFPHFGQRGPAAAIKESAADPGQLAIGVDEETALIVSGVVARVVGSGTISMDEGAGRGAPKVVILRSGDRYDRAMDFGYSRVCEDRLHAGRDVERALIVT
jgi:hypothetical protein